MRRLVRPLLLALCALALAGCPGSNDPEPVDTDGDGFDDDIEAEAGSDPNDDLSVPDDRDGDGVSNGAEVDAGTDPDDAASFPGDDPPPDAAEDDEDDDGPGSSSACEGSGCPDADPAGAACDDTTFEGCGAFEIETQCTNHGDNGPILTTDYGGFSDVLLEISSRAPIADDTAIQLVYLDEDAERVSLPVSGATLRAGGGAAVFVVPIQEADKAHSFSHVLVDGQRVDVDAGGSLDFTSGPFTETGRCTAEEIDAAQQQAAGDGVTF